MSNDRIKALAKGATREQLDTVVGKFHAENPEADSATLVAHLRKQGLLDEAGAREALLGPPDEIRAIPGERPGEEERYEVVGQLGHGAMGEVLIARDPKLRRTVALKRIDARLARRTDIEDRFVTEARVTAQLDHPGIVPVHALQVDPDGVLSYAMKLVRGETLTAYLKATRAFYEAGGAPDEAHALPARIDVFLRICEAMHYAHARGVIHRDLKPDNIMIGAFHEVLVMDWGIAKVTGSVDPTSGDPVMLGHVTETEFGSIVGTPAYMSPEQATARNDEMGPASDQYTLGLILQEVVTLDRANPTGDSMATLHRATEGQRAAMKAKYPGSPVPPPLVAIVDKATALEPKARYANVGALAEDLRRFLRDEPVLARPDTSWQRALRFVGRNRGRVVSVALGFALLLMAALAGSLVIGQARIEEQRRVSAAREAAIAARLAEVSGRALRMDGQLLRFQGLAQGVAWATRHALGQPAPEAALYVGPFDDPSRSPPDLAPSKVYGTPVSTRFPDLALAPSVDPAAARPRLLQLASLAGPLRAALLASVESLPADVAAQDRLILDGGVPLVWTYAATPDGVLVGFPGAGDYPEAYDPRSRAWYRVALDAKAPVWSALDVDESSLGLLLTCSVPVRDDRGALLAIGAIDLPFDWVIEHLLEQGELPGEVFLVDEEGRTVARGSQRETARKMRSYEPAPFQHAALLPKAGAGAASGYVILPGGAQAMLWARLGAVPWSYVVVGPAGQLLGGAAGR